MAPLLSKVPVTEGLGIWGVGVEIQAHKVLHITFRYRGAMFGGSLE